MSESGLREVNLWSGEWKDRILSSNGIAGLKYAQIRTYVDLGQHTVILEVACDDLPCKGILFDHITEPVNVPLAYRVHQCVDRLPIDFEGEFLESVMIALGGVTGVTPEVARVAEECVKKALGEGVLDEIRTSVLPDVAGVVRILSAAGLKVDIEPLSLAVVAGLLEYTAELQEFGVLSREQFLARAVARDQALGLVRPYINAFAELDPTCKKEGLAEYALCLARRGITEVDLLLGYAIMMHMKMANGEGVIDISADGTVDVASVMKARTFPGLAAERVCQLMGDKARPLFTVLSMILGAMYYDIFGIWEESRTDI